MMAGCSGDGAAEPALDSAPSESSPETEACSKRTGDCAAYPQACGDLNQYKNIRIGSEGNDALSGSGSFVAGRGGDDDILVYGEGSCVDGGEGNDTLGADFEPVNGPSGPDVLVGGPGADTFRIGYTSQEELPTIADFEPGVDHLVLTQIEISDAGFLELIPNFDGTNGALTSEATRVIMDVSTGTVWRDEDGSGPSAPEPAVRITNYSQFRLSEDDVSSGPFLD
jgi:hypothetical protein